MKIKVGTKIIQKRMNSKKIEVISLSLLFSFIILIMVSYTSLAVDPQGPDSAVNIKNETKTAPSAYMLNTSGGYISTVNFSVTTQNPRWKAYIGNITGKLTLDDASGSTIYDWTFTTLTGEVYATRNSSTIYWSNIKCANTTILENENILLNHTHMDDNLTATFDDTTHVSFYVGSYYIDNSTAVCPTLNTYVNNATQDTYFEEVVLFDGINETTGGSIIYATIIEDSVTGYNSKQYDFQMIVPDDGLGESGKSIAYYFYIDIT